MSDSDYNRYIERILNDQYEAAGLLKHDLTRGQVRERFIRDQINAQFEGSVICVSGVLSLGGRGKGERYKQCDLAVVPQGVRKKEIGMEHLLNPKDAVIIADVKSFLVWKDIEEWDDIANRVHSIAKKEKSKSIPQVGIIAYRSQSSTKSLFQRFGYEFDRVSDSYVYNKASVQIHALDFVFVIHDYEGDDFRILVRRNSVSRGRQRKDFKEFVFFDGNAAGDGFWDMLNSLCIELK